MMPEKAVVLWCSVRTLRKWSCSFSEEGVSNEILDRRGLPAGGYAWNVEDDDTKERASGRW